MGEVLIGGTASLLICVFLSPKFIEFLRNQEFGQNIRDEGPAGHHAKAGTPTMGGLIIFTAITIPFLFLVLSDRDPGPDRARALGVVGCAVACAAIGFADDYTKIVKKRSLGLMSGSGPACGCTDAVPKDLTCTAYEIVILMPFAIGSISWSQSARNAVHSISPTFVPLA